MASRILVRALHTTTLRAATAPGPAAPAANANPNAKRQDNRPQRSATDLGFSGERRTRVLPSIDIPASARSNFKAGGGSGGGSQRPPRNNGPRPAPRGDGQTPRPRSDRPPRGDRKPRAPAAAAPGELEIPAEFFVGGAKKGADLEVSAEFFDGAELAPSAPRRQRNDRSSGERRDRTPRQRNDRSRNDRNDRKPRDGKPKREVVYSRAGTVSAVRDTSSRGLFGPESLLNPRIKPAHDPTASFWAKGMDRAAAYKADTMRRLGDYSLWVPPPVKEGKDPKARALSRTVFALANNPDVSMRQAASATDAIKKLL